MGQSSTDNDFIYSSFRDCGNLTSTTIELESLVKFSHRPKSLVSLHLRHSWLEPLDEEYWGESIRPEDNVVSTDQKRYCVGCRAANVQGYTDSLDVPTQVSKDGRTLKFLGAASHLQIQSVDHCGT
jgi:hypothetical protein